jgi:hypothetical protein
LTLPALASAATFTASATDAELGNSVHANATLAGGTEPTGTIEFTAFAPGDPACAGTPVFEEGSVPVSGNGEYPSGNFIPLHAGTYHWTAAYSGDLNNPPESSVCLATSVVSQAIAALTTLATSAVVGAAVHDTATLSGGVAPTGTLSFKAFGPNDTTCANPAAFTATVPVSGNDEYESGDFTSSQAGSYRWTVAYSGDTDNAPATSPCNSANETSTVSKASPGISTTATSAAVGAAIKDTATLSGGAAPTGTLTFKTFGPNDATCANAAAFTKTVTVAGNGGYESGNFTAATAGTYRWTAEYAGDANNNAATSPCNAVNESSTVSQVTPTLSSTATNAVVGTAITDSATLSGGLAPTGTLTFKAFGPNDATCSNATAFTKTVTVAGNGSYGSGNFITSAAGTYRWTAEYSGDANNAAASSGCNAVNETSTVSKASPGITSVATNGSVGTAIKDTVTLSGGVTPTGTLTFKAFGPNDATCSNAAAFTKTVAVAGNGAYESTNFVPSLVGTYRWTAEYAGDANNNSVTSACNAVNESSTVTQVTPTLSSTATNAVVGAAISDSATLAGGASPTGNLVFKAFGPNDATCSGAAAYSNTVVVAGAGSYGSGNFTTSAAGSYRWTVAYSGDANNGTATSPCNAANEISTVSKVPPALAITTGSAAIGGAIASLASFGGGISHTGQIVFRAYGPDDPSCSASPVYALALTVTAGNSTYASGQFTPAQAGAFRWTASYSGDAINAAETTACAAAVASVAPAVPTISTHISATSIAAGDGVRNTAMLGAGFKPGGTITFRLFGPSDTTCSSSPALTSTVTVSGNGSYTSAQLVPRQAGDFRFTATYSGDTGNTAVVAACGAGGEFVQVQKRTPTLKARASVRGKKIVAKATLAAADSPRGKVTFRIYAPSDKRCSRKPVFSSQAAVHGSGDYSSAGYRFDKSGLYHFTVAYSGDERNKSLKKGCATRGQSVRVP